MPGMNGAQLAAELRKRDPTLPVPMMMMTGFASMADVDVGGLPRLPLDEVIVCITRRPTGRSRQLR